MRTMMSACGVLCSKCPAFHGSEKGAAHRKKTAAAWRRIFGMKVMTKDISCGGCCASDDQLFHSSLNCKARRCCHSKGFATCAECLVKDCPDLEKAQSGWDEVAELEQKLSRKDFFIYAQPYCRHRQRLVEARRALRQRAH